MFLCCFGPQWGSQLLKQNKVINSLHLICDNFVLVVAVKFLLIGISFNLILIFRLFQGKYKRKTFWTFVFHICIQFFDMLNIIEFRMLITISFGSLHHILRLSFVSFYKNRWIVSHKNFYQLYIPIRKIFSFVRFDTFKSKS